MESADFVLENCIEDALQPLGPSAHKKGIRLIWDVAQDVPTVVRGDATRLRQVIMNLAGNAVKFTEKGEVGVLAKCDRVGADGYLLQFTVADTGIGIAPEKQEKIFEVFAQADMSTTHKFGGTGLGLSICERLVHLMGGNIWLESEPGKGSRFHFTVHLS